MNIHDRLNIYIEINVWVDRRCSLNIGMVRTLYMYIEILIWKIISFEMSARICKNNYFVVTRIVYVFVLFSY